MRGNLVKPPTDSAEEAGDEIGPERQLVGGKQGAGRDAEIGPARLAAEAWCAGRTPGEDLGDGEGTGFGGQEEVLRHGI
jgi:hypothetical protein